MKPALAALQEQGPGGPPVPEGGWWEQRALCLAGPWLPGFPGRGGCPGALEGTVLFSMHWLFF